MKLFSKEKLLAWKMLELINALKLYGIYLPFLSCLLAGAWLMENTSLSPFWASCVGALPGLLFTFLSFPLWFIRQTETPSPWQRWCRRYAIVLGQKTSFLALNRAGDSIQTRDIRFFQYYLSHPQNSENIWADQINTLTFDWQDPTNWPDVL